MNTVSRAIREKTTMLYYKCVNLNNGNRNRTLSTALVAVEVDVFINQGKPCKFRVKYGSWLGNRADSEVKYGS
jgi:hypothetical protein